jgi:hypothetical protein
MNRWIFLLVFLVLFFGFVGGAIVDDSVYEEFNTGEERVRVVVKERSEGFGGRFGALADRGIDRIVDTDEGYVALVDEDDLRDLRVSGEVEEVVRDIPIKTFMQDVVSQVSVDSVWGLQDNGVNLTGSLQSVCILDNGINSSHGDFGGRVLAEKCYCSASDSGGGGCCPDGTVEDSSAVDDYGHGTHVAGIVGASGGISGVATNVGLVVVKIVNATGDGFETDLNLGIQWCIDNADVYNISVITASLGDPSTKMTSSCDATSVATTAKVDAAVGENISFVVSSGNNGWTDGVTWPSCIVNATPVGAVNKIDSLIYNRASLVRLLGVGAGVNSSCLVGDTGYTDGYCSKSGTSMAAPGVAGAIAILNQYLNLTGRSWTPLEIEDVLYNNGFGVSESGNDYSRIDVYSALLSLDYTLPEVGLMGPENDSADMDVNITFSCNATDWQLANISLNVWNSSGLYYNASGDVSGSSNESSFNLINMSEGDYVWNCLVFDVLGNSAWATSNFSFTVGGIYTGFLSPENFTYSNVNNTNFSCRVLSDLEHEISNVSFYLWNSTSDLIYNLSSDVSGFDNTSVFNYSFVDEGNYSWNCLALNNGSNSSWGEENFSFVFDVTAPVISSLAESVSTTGATISWTTDGVSNSSVSGGVSGGSSDYVLNHSVVVSGLSASTNYNYVATSCDRAGNCVNESDAFTTSAAPSNPGGGGSSRSSFTSFSGPRVYDATSSQISKGYTRNLKKDDRVNFSIFDIEGGRHLLTVGDVGDDYVRVLIESDPVNLTLGVGQSVKLNLTSEIYYDLFVKLNSVVDGEAELVLQLINEPIEVAVVEREVVEKEVVEKEVKVGEDSFWGVAILIVVLVLVFGIFFGKRKKRKGFKGRKRGKKKKHGVSRENRKSKIGNRKRHKKKNEKGKKTET